MEEERVKKFIKAYEEIKEQSFIIANINKDFFLEFAECLIKRIKELEDNAEKGKEYFKDAWSFPYSNKVTCSILYEITRKKLHYTEKQKLEKEFKTK